MPARASVSAKPRAKALTPKMVASRTTPDLVGASGWARKPNSPDCLMSCDLGDTGNLSCAFVVGDWLFGCDGFSKRSVDGRHHLLGHQLHRFATERRIG